MASVPEPSFEERIEFFESDAARLAEAALGRLLAPVPGCPEWNLRDLADHVGGVLGFWAAQVVATDAEERHFPPESEAAAGEQLVEEVTANALSLAALLRDSGPEAPCWNWSGRDLTTGWVARRMSLELAVHRYDAELAAGEPSGIPLALAVDGLDERIHVHLASDVPEEPEATLGGSLCLSCTDADSAFVVEVGHGRLQVREGAGPASAFVRGPASELFLFTWNRVPLERLDVTGDAEIAAAWSSLPC